MYVTFSKLDVPLLDEPLMARRLADPVNDGWYLPIGAGVTIGVSVAEATKLRDALLKLLPLEAKEAEDGK